MQRPFEILTNLFHLDRLDVVEEEGAEVGDGDALLLIGRLRVKPMEPILKY